MGKDEIRIKSDGRDLTITTKNPYFGVPDLYEFDLNGEWGGTDPLEKRLEAAYEGEESTLPVERTFFDAKEHIEEIFDYLRTDAWLLGSLLLRNTDVVGEVLLEHPELAGILQTDLNDPELGQNIFRFVKLLITHMCNTPGEYLLKHGSLVRLSQ